jgi:hypothetical protein
MFAALFLLVLTGLMIHFASNAVSRRLLSRWHASEQRRDLSTPARPAHEQTNSN